MKSYRYRIVDVFTEMPLEGNALAVFPDATGLDAQHMQKIARELNLSETTFVVPSSRPGCVVGVRIFTPTREMLFAGHPTIGTSFVLLEEGIVPANTEHFVLDDKVGPFQFVWSRANAHSFGFALLPSARGSSSAAPFARRSSDFRSTTCSLLPPNSSAPAIQRSSSG